MPARNEPCPCGSGKKYKRCHLDADEVLARQGRSERVEPSGVPSVANPGPGDGPAEQMVAFMQPLLEQTDGSEKQIGKVMQLGALLWSLALTPADEREQRVREIAERSSGDEADRTAFVETARTMIARHEAMFPWLHEERRRGGAT